MEYAILVKIIDNKYIVSSYGEYEKLYKVYRNLNDEYMILEIDLQELEEIKHDSCKLQEKVEELIQKKKDMESIN